MLSPESLKDREAQTRYFDTGGEQMLLSAGAQVLQDLGFNLDESETDLGVIVGSKHRDATDGGQIAAAFTMALLFGVHMPTDSDQVIRVSLVTRPMDLNKQQVEKVTDKLRQKLVLKIQDKTRQVLRQELSEGLEGQINSNIIAGLTEKMALMFGEQLSSELKQQLNEGRTAVRVTFQRMIYNTARQVTTAEPINDPKIYQEFFDKVSESVFLEAHAI